MLLQQALQTVKDQGTLFEAIAEKRARELLDDHRRVREAGDASGVRYSVTPALPVDIIGIYVLMPSAGR